eukprot:gene506-637_t
MLKFTELYDQDNKFKVDVDRFRSIPTEEKIKETIKSLELKNHVVTIVDDEPSALDLIKKLIPEKADVMAAGSVSLMEIGFNTYNFSDECKWNNLHKKILAEKDYETQMAMRKRALAADYFLSSVSSITKQGDLFIADASGTRVGGFTAAQNVIIVAGVNKIVDSESEGLLRTTDFCFPSENVRAKYAYKNNGSVIQNILQIRNGAFPGLKKYHIILVLSWHVVDTDIEFFQDTYVPSKRIFIREPVGNLSATVKLYFNCYEVHFDLDERCYTAINKYPGISECPYTDNSLPDDGYVQINSTNQYECQLLDVGCYAYYLINKNAAEIYQITFALMIIVMASPILVLICVCYPPTPSGRSLVLTIGYLLVTLSLIATLLISNFGLKAAISNRIFTSSSPSVYLIDPEKIEISLVNPTNGNLQPFYTYPDNSTTRQYFHILYLNSTNLLGFGLDNKFKNVFDNLNTSNSNLNSINLPSYDFFLLSKSHFDVKNNLIYTLNQSSILSYDAHSFVQTDDVNIDVPSVIFSGESNGNVFTVYNPELNQFYIYFWVPPFQSMIEVDEKSSIKCPYLLGCNYILTYDLDSGKLVNTVNLGTKFEPFIFGLPVSSKSILCLQQYEREQAITNIITLDPTTGSTKTLNSFEVDYIYSVSADPTSNTIYVTFELNGITILYTYTLDTNESNTATIDNIALEAFSTGISTVPSELTRNFALIKELDFRSDELITKIEEYKAQLVNGGASGRKTAIEMVDPNNAKQLKNDLKTIIEYADEKVELSNQTYELIDRHIRKLDQDLKKFEQEIENLEEEKKKKKSKQSLSVDSGPNKKGKARDSLSSSSSSSSLVTIGRKKSEPSVQSRESITGNVDARVFNANPNDLDMAIDPNEPTYCFCNRVSFGEMIGCENPDCKIEWFHFECVGLTSTPKGKWYCPDCSKKRNLK